MEQVSKAVCVARRRQDPISCRLCRVKKLKCSRQQPCSNCIARNATCEFEPNHITTTARIQQDVQPSNADILSKLQRLEEMILRMNQSGPHTPDSFITRKYHDQTGPELTPIEESMQFETEGLSSIGTQQPSAYPAISATWLFETIAIDLIVDESSISTELAGSWSQQKRRILLPNYGDAQKLFDSYVKQIRHYHQILHVPTLRTKIFENFYSRLAKNESVDTDHAALLLSIFASVIYYLMLAGDRTISDALPKNSSSLFLIFFKYALDLTDHSRRVLPGSLEIVQTTIILLFMDFNLEGCTLRTRNLLAQGIQTAKEMSMHRLDTPAATAARGESMSIEAMIELEIKRRVWWHLLATDSLISLAGSPQEGTYLVIPQQARVNLPRNIDDEALDRGIMDDLPLTQPTSMSYSLQRIRLAKLSREAVDMLKFGLASVHEIDYENVLLLDRRIENHIEDLPLFLRMDVESVQKSQYVLERYPFFTMQRYVASIGAYTMRCKIHQPFLVKAGAIKYAQSAEICLKSAIKIIEINKTIREDEAFRMPLKVTLCGFVHHMFLATVVLVMDLCFNRTTDDSDPRATGIRYAIQLMEESKHDSIPVQRFLDKLTDVLRRYHIQVNEDIPVRSSSRGNSSLHASQTLLGTREIFSSGTTADTPQTSSTQGYEEIWKDALYPEKSSNVLVMPEMPDWDQLFSELDTFIV